MSNSYSIPEDELRQQASAVGITHSSTGVAVVHQGKVLAVRREGNDFLGGNFELPGGGIEDGETFEQAIRREVLEETGLTVTDILGMFPGFDYATPKKSKVRQFNFLVAVENTNVKLSPEHDEFVWLTDEASVDTLMTTEAMKLCMKDALAVAEDLIDVE